MLAIFEQVLILLVFSAAGFGLCKAKVAKTEHANLLSALVVYVFGPCLSFDNFSRNFNTAYLSERYVLLIVALVLLALSYPMATLTAKLLTKKPYSRAVYHYILTVPNYGYIGYALCLALYGELGLLDMMIFALPMAVYATSIGYSMLTSPGDGKVDFRRIFSPSLIATFLGAIVGLSGLKLPEVLTSITGQAAACLAPGSMILTGIVVARFNLKKLLLQKKSYAVSAIRLIGIPVLVWGLVKLGSWGLSLFGLPGLGEDITAMMPVIILTYAMPCGMNTIVFPELVGEDCTIGASAVLISSAAALITIPLCLTALL